MHVESEHNAHPPRHAIINVNKPNSIGSTTFPDSPVSGKIIAKAPTFLIPFSIPR